LIVSRNIYSSRERKNRELINPALQIIVSVHTLPRHCGLDPQSPSNVSGQGIPDQVRDDEITYPYNEGVNRGSSQRRERQKGTPSITFLLHPAVCVLIRVTNNNVTFWYYLTRLTYGSINAIELIITSNQLD